MSDYPCLYCGDALSLHGLILKIKDNFLPQSR